MAYILLAGCDTERNIQEMRVKVLVNAKRGYYQTARYHAKIKEIEADFQAVLEKYFGECESEIMSNHEYNTIRSNK